MSQSKLDNANACECHPYLSNAPFKFAEARIGIPHPDHPGFAIIGYLVPIDLDAEQKTSADCILQLIFDLMEHDDMVEELQELVENLN